MAIVNKIDINSSGEPGNFLNYVYPVGSIYTSVNSVNPSTLFGGTWEEFGKGQVLVGVDSSQTEFNTVKKSGGEKTHLLTGVEMPAHSHGMFGNSSTYPTSASGAAWQVNKAFMGHASGERVTLYSTAFGTNPTGGGQAHNNLQPYITVYRWIRTA